MKIIVNADDFGLSTGANYGILEAHLNGIVTSTTMMVTMPGFEHAVELSKKYPTLGIGLHLNITFGEPLTKCSTIINNNGNFFKPKENPNQDKFDEQEIYNEFLEQYKLFVEKMGKKPTHIDSHLYSHQKYEKAKNAAIKLANEMDIAIREFNSINFESAIFLEFFKFNNNNLKSIILEKLNELKENKIYELMVHPAYIDKFILENSSYTIGRLEELQVLTDIDIKNKLKEKNVQLITFAETRRKNV